MSGTAASYAPAWVLMVWALLLIAGADPLLSMVPGLLAEGVAVAYYIGSRRR